MTVEDIRDEEMNVQNEGGGPDVEYEVDDEPVLDRSDFPAIRIRDFEEGQVVKIVFAEAPKAGLVHTLNGVKFFSENVPRVVKIQADGLEFSDTVDVPPPVVAVSVAPSGAEDENEPEGSGSRY